MKSWNKEVILIIVVGLIIRLVLLPYSQVIHADAVSRIIQAQEWLANPRYIVAAVWGPLNQYLFGFSIKFLGGKIYGPKIINILFAVFTTYPLYWFTRNVFNTRSGAILVACIYTLTPLVIRNSFQALPAVPFAFFLALSMYYLSAYLKEEKIVFVMLSALAINLAGALRYEAWIISFLFGVILLLNKHYRSFLIFGGIASLFPLSWILGGYIIHNDWLYSFHYSTEWANQEIPKINEITRVDLVKRILFFPFSIFVVFSPLVFALILYIIPSSLIKKRVTKKQIIWLMPFAILFVLYIYKATTGTLLLQHKYTITLLVLLLPFIALLFVQTKKYLQRFAFISVVLIIPLSYILNDFPWKKIFSFSSSLSLAVDDLFVETYGETKIVPRLKDENFCFMVEKMKTICNDGEGIITDFLGWENTYYLSLHSQKTPFIIPGATHDEININELENYLLNHPSGLIVFNYFGKLLSICEGNGDTVKINNIKAPLFLTLIHNENGYMLYKYKLLPEYEDVFVKSDKTILDFKKDTDYFVIKIKNDRHWLKSLKEQAKKENKPLGDVIQSNAEYCYSMGYE